MTPHPPLTQQIAIALSRSTECTTTVQDVLQDVEAGALGAIIIPGAHAIYRWTTPDTIEVVSVYGDMALMREFYAISRALGARRWEWVGRGGWYRALQMLERDANGRQV